MIRLILLCIGVFAVMKLATASPIAPGPVWSGYPQFEAPCDGFTLGVSPFGCITGETRTVSALGEVVARYLRPTPLAEPPAILPPVWVETPVAPEMPLLSATPEPELRDLFVLLLAGVVIWRLFRSETTGGGK